MPSTLSNVQHIHQYYYTQRRCNRWSERLPVPTNIGLVAFMTSSALEPSVQNVCVYTSGGTLFWTLYRPVTVDE